MDYKEKYEQALERAETLIEKLESNHIKGFIYHIFPELKENEDERIRKGLIKAVSGILKGNTLYGTDVTREEAITWLEKQGEQKPTLPKWKYKKDNIPLLKDSLILNKYGCVAKSPSGAIVSDVWVLDYDELAKLPKEELEKQGEQKTADKTEPKFKVRDWCIDNQDGTIFQIESVTENTYVYKTDKGNSYSCTHSSLDLDSRLWTIQDAKDGDVLLEEETGEPFIYNGNRATYFSGYFLGAYCGIYKGEFNPYGNIHHWGKNSCPATKEQCVLLFQKMKEAGYEWDADKKELKKIDPEFDADNVLSLALGNNQIQDILEDMGMLDDNGQCPHTAEEIFKAGMEHAYNLNREAASSVKLDTKNK